MRESARQPFGNTRFRLEIDKMSGMGAVEVIFPEARLTVVPRLKPSVEYGVLTIRRGVTGSREWYDWWDLARSSASAPRRSVTVVLLDGAGADAMRWTFDDTRPQGYLLSPLDALNSAPLIESLELAVGGFATSFDSPRSARRTRK
jgi:hypothetical protein